MKLTKTFAAALICLSLGATSSVVHADVIHGEIVVSGGGATPTGTDANGDGTIQLGEASGIDFTSPGLVFGATQDFAAISLFTAVTFADFIFNPSTGVDPLWTLTSGASTFSFSADNFSVASQSNVFLNIIGSGTISGTGFDDTSGNWSFTMTSLGTQFGWSSSTVPEPASILLFGLGLLGVGAAKRRKTR